MPMSVIEIMFYVEGKIVVKLVFWLGLSDLIMARQIAGNLPCLELLTDLGCWSYGIDKALKGSNVVYIKLQLWMNFSVLILGS